MKKYGLYVTRDGEDFDEFVWTVRPLLKDGYHVPSSPSIECRPAIFPIEKRLGLKPGEIREI